MGSKLQAIPEGYTTVTPWIIGKDTAGLMDFLIRAFGAQDMGRMADESGRIGHAEMIIGNSRVMMFDAPDGWPPTPAFIRLYLQDAQASFDRAVREGAEPVTNPTHLAFGDAVGRVRDPYGNLWWLQQRLEEVSEAEATRRWNEPRWAEAMNYVQSSIIRFD
jgi:PhnB protein